jgi:hypothetical protein
MIYLYALGETNKKAIVSLHSVNRLLFIAGSDTSLDTGFIKYVRQWFSTVLAQILDPSASCHFAMQPLTHPARVHSFSSLSHDRSKASSKASCPHSAI